jgi:hypothetical protein
MYLWLTIEDSLSNLFSCSLVSSNSLINPTLSRDNFSCSADNAAFCSRVSLSYEKINKTLFNYIQKSAFGLSELIGISTEGTVSWRVK